MSITAWTVGRHLASREVARVHWEYAWVRERIARRREELRRALEEPDQLDRPVYVMLVNELMWCAQMERRWMHGAEDHEGEDVVS